MGFFDGLANKAKEVAESAKKAAAQAFDDVSSTAKDLAEKATAEGSNLFDKASEGFSSLSESVGTSAKELSEWAESMPDKLRKMSDDFDADAMWDKLSKTAAKAGQELIVMVLTIYYALESKILGKQKADDNGK